MKRKPEIYPAPSIPGAIPPRKDILQELWEAEKNDTAVLFSLGNIFFREGQLAEAEAKYRQLLELDSAMAAARCNLGIVCRAMGRQEEALGEFSRCILQKPELSLALFNLAELQMERGEMAAALSSFERLLRQEPQHVAANTALGRLYEQAGDLEKAHRYYEQSFALEPGGASVRNRLGMFCFYEGKRFFEEGDLLTAFEVWGKGYRKYAGAFSAEKGIVSGMSLLVKEFNQRGGVDCAFGSYEVECLGGNITEDLHYQHFLSLYFSLGLLPEFYEEKQNIPSEIERLSSSLQGNAKFPLLHFRLGIMYACLGKFELALEHLSISADSLPLSKKRPLKIDRAIAYVKRALQMHKAREGSLIQEPIDEWEANGFSNPFEQQSWKNAGASPKEAAAWKEAFFSAAQFKQWRPYGLSPERAAQWLFAGISDPKDAARFYKAGFAPEEAVKWQEHFSGAVEEAIQYHSAGFADPAVARCWTGVFTFPWEAASWYEQGFSLAQTRQWMERGVKDPFCAKQKESEAAVKVDNEGQS